METLQGGCNLTLSRTVIFGNASGVDSVEMIVLYYWSLWDEICVLLYPLGFNSIYERPLEPNLRLRTHTFTIVFSFPPW